MCRNKWRWANWLWQTPRLMHDAYWKNNVLNLKQLVNFVYLLQDCCHNDNDLIAMTTTNLGQQCFRKKASLQRLRQKVSGFVRLRCNTMIPPAESLLKYGNPILINKHAGKKSSKVNLLSKKCYFYIIWLRYIQNVSSGKKGKLMKNNKRLKKERDCSCNSTTNKKKTQLLVT